MKKETMSHEAEARLVLSEKVAELRSLGYGCLWSMMKCGTHGPSELAEVCGKSGALYQLEADVMWDGEADGDLRVIVALFEECLTTRTISNSFIVSPVGSVVDA